MAALAQRGKIRSALAQLGLLDQRNGRFGFRDLASVRQIAKLLNDGVRLSEIIRAVREIRKWLPDFGLAKIRLHPGVLRDVQVEQHGGRTDKYGQFVLGVEEARDDPDDLFERAQSAELIGDIVEAERLYRLLMKSDPTDASAPFNLGNMLRAAARTVEVEAALRAATRANPAFAEAWYNLVPVKSPSCSTTEFACRKSSALSAKSGNGFLILDWPRFGFIRVFSATFKSNSMADELTNTASSSLELRRPATIPMTCSSGHNLLS